jgi:hypothetical protein
MKLFRSLSHLGQFLCRNSHIFRRIPNLVDADVLDKVHCRFNSAMVLLKTISLATFADLRFCKNNFFNSTLCVCKVLTSCQLYFSATERKGHNRYPTKILLESQSLVRRSLKYHSLSKRFMMMHTVTVIDVNQ